MEKTARAQILGRYLIADPDICHGKPTFRGTRILVADVLDQVAAGLAWETIIEEWRGSITQEAIAEAVRLARQAFLEHVSDTGGMVVPREGLPRQKGRRWDRDLCLWGLSPRRRPP